MTFPSTYSLRARDFIAELGVDDECQLILAKAVERKEEDRWESVEEFCSTLGSYLERNTEEKRLIAPPPLPSVGPEPPRVIENQPFDLVVFGATGDLARRLLIPSIYRLHKGKSLPVGRIIGLARMDWSTEKFRRMSEDCCKDHLSSEEVSEEALAGFLKRLHYCRLASVEAAEMEPLAKLLDESPERLRIFYFATTPLLYGELVQSLSRAGLVTPTSRLALEEPSSVALASAETIDRLVSPVFRENQDLSDRSFSRPGGGPESSGSEIWQHSFRAPLECQLHRSCPDHRCGNFRN